MMAPAGRSVRASKRSTNPMHSLARKCLHRKSRTQNHSGRDLAGHDLAGSDIHEVDEDGKPTERML